MLYSTRSKLIFSFLSVALLVGTVSLIVGWQLLYDIVQQRVGMLYVGVLNFSRQSRLDNDPLRRRVFCGIGVFWGAYLRPKQQQAECPIRLPAKLFPGEPIYPSPRRRAYFFQTALPGKGRYLQY